VSVALAGDLFVCQGYGGRNGGQKGAGDDEASSPKAGDATEYSRGARGPGGESLTWVAGWTVIRGMKDSTFESPRASKRATAGGTIRADRRSDVEGRTSLGLC
jgi:hypothetical protein